MIAALSFLLKISATVLPFYWLNDTPWSSSPSQFVHGTDSSLPCSFGFVCHILLFVYFFFKVFISFIGSLDECHTSFFNTLITSGEDGKQVPSDIILCRETCVITVSLKTNYRVK